MEVLDNCDSTFSSYEHKVTVLVIKCMIYLIEFINRICTPQNACLKFILI